MKNLVDYYLSPCQNYATNRVWEDWPFHKFYNYRENQNGGMKCVDKWREIVNSNMETILAETDFDHLYSTLQKLASAVPGIGSLHVYDTATCFAQPNEVHLNCGAMEAAKAINLKSPIRIRNGKAPYSDFVAYNKDLGRLTPLQLEDFLCINKKVFQNILTPSEQLKLHQKRNAKRSSCTGGISSTPLNKCIR